ncbi:WxL domain-containing protein [Enterococcus hirae]|uniref:WxL domain-containing protein n=1 Tax=Enterococcus hirae TaxID=1354 RepID=UPI0019659A8C|nr:WxL domain-containing protein [Enterococcus hirae]EMF0208635.1 WxL domain-containing protein [Enterococcus hirae]EMF0212108.1 WxL domain-containing protein [Enterococcus hirae]MBV6972973.1 WxL domain-containing protein [Enterococcus hirae]MBZ3624756.1 WxL domain-containing protein [Enterococcus hirae]MCL4597433.1 WxL domain-containing protein [Enterococcus hirae]
MKKKTLSFFILGISLFSSSLVFADSQTQGEVAYVEGALEFDYAGGIPTNLDFGDHPLQTAAAENWIATATATPTTGTVAVRDNRGNPAATWTVKLSQTDQFKTADDVELSGAQLNLSFGALTNNLGLAPTSAYENDELAIQVFNQDATILDATAGQNSGDTALAINQFSLSVPANTNKIAEQYTTTLNWTFSSSPTN